MALREAISRFLKSLPQPVEFAFVVSIAFGLPILSSLFVLTHPGPHHTNTPVLSLIGFELGVLAIVGMFLRARGWSFQSIGLEITGQDTAIGVALFAVFYFVYATLFSILAALAPQVVELARSTLMVSPRIGWSSILAMTIVNPVFEEVLVAGYVISALKERHSHWFCTNVSVAIRLLYHLYLGPLGVISAIPMGLILAQWFARTGRLWPLIVAHAIGDLIPLLVMSGLLRT
jgi:membrane protease YdiL (CAAX protease family)